jgi:sulfur carrier protein
MTQIVLNGAPYQVAAGQTLNDLINVLELSEKAIAVAVNRHVIARPQWHAYLLQEQDQVDVVRAIGGG